MENVRRRWFYYCFEWYIQHILRKHSIFRLDTHVPKTYLCAVTLKQQ